MYNRFAYLGFVLGVGIGIILLFRIPQLQFLQDWGLRALSPFQGVVSAPLEGLNDYVNNLQSVSELQQENQRLRAEVDRLTRELASLPELTKENAQLREVLNLQKARPSYQWLPARIIGSDPSNLIRAVIIDKGANDGVQKGMTVVSARGSLVGKVLDVKATTAKVLLITDVTSSVTARVEGSGAEGVVSGQRNGPLVMRYISQVEIVKTGDKVVTSGKGGVFPEGFPIGMVLDVRQKDIELYQEARIESAVDFRRLEGVLIITNHLPVKLE